jgi:hypothetical protein
MAGDTLSDHLDSAEDELAEDHSEQLAEQYGTPPTRLEGLRERRSSSKSSTTSWSPGPLPASPHHAVSQCVRGPLWITPLYTDDALAAVLNRNTLMKGLFCLQVPVVVAWPASVSGFAARRRSSATNRCDHMRREIRGPCCRRRCRTYCLQLR